LVKPGSLDFRVVIHHRVKEDNQAIKGHQEMLDLQVPVVLLAQREALAVQGQLGSLELLVSLWLMAIPSVYSHPS